MNSSTLTISYSETLPRLVPLRVYQHNMLRPLLLVQQEICPHEIILGGISAAWSRTGNRPCVDNPVFYAYVVFPARN